MALQLFKESLSGKYDGVTSPTLLSPGAISDGLNVRKVSSVGGWRPRKGVTSHNVTALAAASILSLHQYTHPRNEDYHFLAQCNGSLYDASDDPSVTVDIAKNGIYKWTKSSTGTFEYYCELDAGGDPSLNEPTIVTDAGVIMDIGTVGSLTAGTWDWGDNDTLGYSTIYVYLSSGVDPDSLADGVVLAGPRIAFAASALTALASSTKPGFGDTIGELFLYADGSGAPVIWGGDEPFCTGFAVYDDSETSYVDYTRVVKDERSDTVAVVLGAASDLYYVYSPQIAEGIKLDLGTSVNTSTELAMVKGWQSGAWTELGDSVRSATYKWTVSGSGTGEYYLEVAAGGSSGILEPQSVTEGGSLIDVGTLGSLAASKWGWGDNDSLGFSTLYVRQDDDADPDGETAGHIKVYFDTTNSSGKTHAVDGSITWTRNASDTMRVINGIMGYWYQVSFSGALSGSVDVVSCKVNFDPARLTNKWDGVYQIPLAVRFYDNSAGLYVDYTGKLTNESTSQYLQMDAAEAADFIYVKSVEPLAGIGFGVTDGYENTGDAQITATDGVQHWDGDSWVDNAIAAANDETLDVGVDSSFAQSGTVWWNAAGLTVKRRTMSFDSIPGYWYRVSWDAAPDNTGDDVRVYFIATASFPESLPAYDGVIEFKGRAFLWGDPEFPNRLRFSCKDRPDCYTGADSGYTDAFGDMTAINCVIRFYNELLIFKPGSVWLLEGYSPPTFGATRIADTVGCAAPKTPQVIELGSPSMHRDERLSICLWMDTDGVYALDGRKPGKNSSEVEHYFNTEFTTAIAASDIDDCQAFVDPLNNEYHLLMPNGGSGPGVELVYNSFSDEWYPPWSRTVGGANDYLVCGLALRGADNRYYTYAGGSAGRVYRLEYDASDKNASNADVAIQHNIKTRAISATPGQTTTLTFTLRKAWIEARARTSPTTRTITTSFYKDMALTGTEITTPAVISLANAGYNLVADGVDTSQIRCISFQLKFEANTIDLEMEIWSFMYSLEALGEIGQE